MKQYIFNFACLSRATSKYFLASTLILAVACLSTSCSHPSGKSFEPQELLPGWKKETVHITLPEYPAESHPSLAGWKIIYWNEAGGDVQFLAPSQQEVSITMKKNIPATILCYPLTSMGNDTVSFFHPAGCIYPYSTTARWEEGFTAETFCQLAQSKSLQQLSSSPLLHFNWPRLTQQVTKKFQQAQEKGSIFSPWFLQQELIKANIQQGTASTRSIKQETLQEVELTELHHGEIIATDSSEHTKSFQEPLYYRYIPLGQVQESIHFPKTEGYNLHPENAFWQSNRIVSCFTKKNQKPVLATIGVERYTNKQ